MNKKNVLWGSGLAGGIFVFLALALVYNLCGPYRSSCREIYGLIAYIFSPLPFVFLLSVITYKMPEEVFRSWWSIARWFVPLIVILTILIEVFPMGGGGWIGLYDELPYQFLGLLYLIFIAVSLVKIFLAHRRTN